TLTQLTPPKHLMERHERPLISKTRLHISGIKYRHKPYLLSAYPWRRRVYVRRHTAPETKKKRSDIRRHTASGTKKSEAKKKPSFPWGSQAVPQPSTSPAFECLTSEFE